MVDTLSFGQRSADYASAKIGSWAFLIVFNTMMAIWIALNVYAGPKAFDPAPFIGLNLVLSWLAGIQAPLIMISQNRQDEIQKETVESIAAIGRATYEVAEATQALLSEHTDILRSLSGRHEAPDDV